MGYNNSLPLARVCIVVLNWQGQKYFNESLPSIIQSVSDFKQPCSIILLDNNEEDETDRAWVRRNFPQIHVVQSPKNDFLYSYNWLLEGLTEEIIILLNNDVKVDPKFITPLIQHFSDPETFAVSARAYDWEGINLESGPYTIRQHRGWFYWMPDVDKQFTSYTLFTCGGYMAVDRKKFLSIGGFDRLFYPAYGEDLDLCYRAWLNGWKSIYEPGSIVYHLKSGSWNSKKDNRSLFLNLRATFIFQFKYLYRFPQSIFYKIYIYFFIARKVMERDVTWLKAFQDSCAIWKKECEHHRHNLDLKQQKTLHKLFSQSI